MEIDDAYEAIETPGELSRRMRVDSLAADLAFALTSPCSVPPSERDTIPAIPCAKSTLRCAE